MINLLRILSFILLFSFAGVAHAAVLDFEGLTSNDCCDLIPDGYGGFTWSDDFSLINGGNYHPGSGYDTGTVSGEYTAFNSWENDVSIENGTFTWNGAYFTAAWNNGLNITVEGWAGGSMVYTNTVVVNTTGPTWFDFNYENIDTVMFSSSGGTNAGYGGYGTHFAMDNFTYNASVPEPSTLLLMGSGMAGLALFRRKFPVQR